MLSVMLLTSPAVKHLLHILLVTVEGTANLAEKPKKQVSPNAIVPQPVGSLDAVAVNCTLVGKPVFRLFPQRDTVWIRAKHGSPRCCPRGGDRFLFLASLQS